MREMLHENGELCASGALFLESFFKNVSEHSSGVWSGREILSLERRDVFCICALQLLDKMLAAFCFCKTSSKVLVNEEREAGGRLML